MARCRDDTAATGRSDRRRGRIRGLLLTEENVDRVVALLAQAIKESLPGSPGAGMSLMDAAGKRTSSAATDSLVEKLDAAQYELGEGPCLTAWATGTVVIIDDLQTDSRWPEAPLRMAEASRPAWPAGTPSTGPAGC